MIKVFNNAEMKTLKGTYNDPGGYFVDEEELELFDKFFPLKVKQVRPGQLSVSP